MKVSFSIDLKPESGKQNFAILLAKSFAKKGIKVTNKNPDVNLVFVKKARSDCKNILRLDGAWINNKMNYKSKNSSIASVMKKCDAVIYQSQYSKQVCEKFIGKHRRNTVIYNGCDPGVFINKYKHPKPYIVACSRWRPHKRLSTMIDGFLNSGIYNKYDLIVCGETDSKVEHPSIIYLGALPIKKVYEVIAGCIFVVHLAYLDCCPNSVIEALVAGKKVLCTDSGGTAEIVRDSGVIIKESPYDFTPIDLYNTPLLYMDDIVKGYNILDADMMGAPRNDLCIDTIADQYIVFMKNII